MGVALDTTSTSISPPAVRSMQRTTVGRLAVYQIVRLVCSKKMFVSVTTAIGNVSVLRNRFGTIVLSMGPCLNGQASAMPRAKPPVPALVAITLKMESSRVSLYT